MLIERRLFEEAA